jgi:single-strand DNA-binding protein
MLNQCQFIGRLGADPETCRMANGDPVVNLRLAVSERWRDKSGERQERTEWITVVIFNENIAKVAEQYLRKGSMLFVSGKLQTREWQDKEGQKRYSTEIV